MNKVIAFIGLCLVLSRSTTAGQIYLDPCQPEPLCTPVQSTECFDLMDQSTPFPEFGTTMDFVPNELFLQPQECCGDEPCCDECTCFDEDAECCDDSECECDCGCDCCCANSGRCTSGGGGGGGAGGCGYAGGGYGGGFGGGGGGLGSGFGSGLASLAPLAAAGLLSGRSGSNQGGGRSPGGFSKKPHPILMDPMSMMDPPSTMDPPMFPHTPGGGGGGGGGGNPPNMAAVPEPSSVVLFTIGTAGLVLRRVRKKKV